MAKIKSTELMKECDSLWSKLIKLRAGNKSELSGQTENLQSHHIIEKTAGYRLRYDLDNGICLTQSEHFSWHFHSDKREIMRKQIMKLRGKDVFIKLAELKSFKSKTDLKLVKLFLEKEISFIELDNCF